MSLRYSFRHLFYGGEVNKKRLYEILKDLDSAESGESADISALEEVVGDEDSGLVKSVADLTTAVSGKADSSHTHTISNVSDATTTTITVTYTDDSTDSITFVTQSSS